MKEKGEKAGATKTFRKWECKKRREGDIVREQRHQIKIVGKNRPSQADMRDAITENSNHSLRTPLKRSVYLHLFLSSTPLAI
jgi:hypothetical protein